MISLKFRRYAAGVAISMLACATSAVAAYPEQTITLIVPFTAGGTTDQAARLVAQLLQASTGASVVVENKPGAGGMVGAQHVKKAEPNGYTLLYGSDSLILQPLVQKSALTSVDDFIPLVRVRTSPTYMGVGPAAPVNSVKELVALAKSRPGKLDYATGGVGEVNHMSGAAFALAAGVDIVHVPYKGVLPAITDTAAGHVAIVWGGSIDFLPYLKTGQLKVLAQAGTKRSLAMPEVPTFTELGYPDVVIVNWNGILAPKGTPPEVVKWLTEKIAAVATSPEFLERGKILAIEPGDMLKGQAFADALAQQQARYKTIIAKSGIRLVD